MARRSGAAEARIVRKRYLRGSAAVEGRMGFVVSLEVTADREAQGEPHARVRGMPSVERCRGPVRQRHGAWIERAGARRAPALAQAALWRL